MSSFAFLGIIDGVRDVSAACQGGFRYELFTFCENGGQPYEEERQHSGCGLGTRRGGSGTCRQRRRQTDNPDRLGHWGGACRCGRRILPAGFLRHLHLDEWSGDCRSVRSILSSIRHIYSSGSSQKFVRAIRNRGYDRGGDPMYRLCRSSYHQRVVGRFRGCSVIHRYGSAVRHPCCQSCSGRFDRSPSAESHGRDPAASSRFRIGHTLARAGSLLHR